MTTQNILWNKTPISLFDKLEIVEYHSNSYFVDDHLATLLENIKSNLSRLLNNKRRNELFYDHNDSIIDTCLNAGLPELSSYNPSSDSDRKKIFDLILHVIQSNEKRLTDITLQDITSTTHQNDSTIHLKIRAKLLFEGKVTQVTFSSLVIATENKIKLGKFDIPTQSELVL